MSADLFPLAIYGAAQAGDLEYLQAAKASLNLPYLITPVQAVPGSPTRVLAIREAPGFICEWWGVRDPANIADLAEKMAWALDPSVHDPRAIDIDDMMLQAFGEGTVPVTDWFTIDDTPDEDDSDQRFTEPRRRHNPND